VRLLALNIQHAAEKRVPLIRNVVFDAAPDVVVLSEFCVGAQGDRLLGLLEADGLVYHRHGVPGSDLNPYTVAVASRTAIVGVGRPLEGSSHAQRILEAEIAGITVAAVYFPLAKQQIRSGTRSSSRMSTRWPAGKPSWPETGTRAHGSSTSVAGRYRA
jgi:exonuclease III